MVGRWDHSASTLKVKKKKKKKPFYIILVKDVRFTFNFL